MKLLGYTPTHQGLGFPMVLKTHPNFPKLLSLIFNDELFKIQ